MSYAKSFLGLTAILFLAATVSSQQGVDDQKKAQGVVEDPEASGDAAGGAADRNAPRVADGPFFDIRVQQDPIRIAPGESGKLILVVTISSGDEIDPSGIMQAKTVQGPLMLGGAVWDPAPDGQMRHKDTFLIQVPISVKAKTEYGKYPVAGTVKMTGRFRNGPRGAPGTGVVNADATGAEVAGGVVPDSGAVPSKAEYGNATGRFSHFVVVGAPMPKAVKPVTRGGPPQKAGPSVTAANEQEPAAKGKADQSGGAKGAEKSYPKLDNPANVSATKSGAPEPADVEPGEAPVGIPNWIISLGLVLVAAVLFFMPKKR